MAKSVKARITPEVLKWVRERRIRLTIDYAADKLKVRPIAKQNTFLRLSVLSSHESPV